MSYIIIIDKFGRRKQIIVPEAIGVPIAQQMTPDFIEQNIIPHLPEPGEITPEQLEGIVEDVIEQIEIPEGMTQAQVLNITLW